jgi:hypothetical protein
MANEQGKPVGRDWEYDPGEVADRLGTPTADIREVITDDRQVNAEPMDEQGMVQRDDDGYVGQDGKMQPHQSPLEVPQRIDPELDAASLDATERQGIDDFQSMWE